MRTALASFMIFATMSGALAAQATRESAIYGEAYAAMLDGKWREALAEAGQAGPES